MRRKRSIIFDTILSRHVVLLMVMVPGRYVVVWILESCKKGGRGRRRRRRKRDGGESKCLIPEIQSPIGIWVSRYQIPCICWCLDT